MSPYLEILLLICGFLLLIKGADWLVEGASSLAERFSISPLLIGLTIVAFGTSAPELVVNVIAALKNNSILSYSNIVGSNTINILLILGTAALIRPLKTERNTVWREIPFALLAVVAVWILSFDSLWDGSVSDLLSRGDAVVLLLFFAVFLTYVFGLAKIEPKNKSEIKTKSLPRAVFLFCIGFACLILGGNLVVTNAVSLAQLLGISEKVIGITIVAIGTSLPELATSAVAAYKNKIDIAVGNVVGSNIFNALFILGITGVISPLPYTHELNFDFAVLLIATFLLFFSLFTGQRRQIDRWEAIVFLVVYIFYTAFTIFEAL